MVSFVFQRYETKFRLSMVQYRTVLEEIERRMTPDAFGQSTVQSLYYDTDDFRMIRASIEKPVYKEKLRARCYGLNTEDKDVFFEMKRKYDGVVYKRRLSCKEQDLAEYEKGDLPPTQIGKELSYFIHHYGGVCPKIMILYDRVAYYDATGDFRVTFDFNIRYRTDRLNFHSDLEGDLLLPHDTVLMEVKSPGAIPLWLCDLICNLQIPKKSFSKYGAAYLAEQFNKTSLRSELLYV